MYFRNTKVYFQSTKVYSRSTKVYSPSTKVYFQSTSILSNYTSILSKNKSLLWKYESILWKYKSILWRKNPKTRLLRVLFDSIDLLALFGVYAGIIFFKSHFGLRRMARNPFTGFIQHSVCSTTSQIRRGRPIVIQPSQLSVGFAAERPVK